MGIYSLFGSNDQIYDETDNSCKQYDDKPEKRNTAFFRETYFCVMIDPHSNNSTANKIGDKDYNC